MGSFRLPVPLRVALLYALFGGAWILFSDTLLNALVPDHATYVAIQTYKGWAYVLASAVLIYLLVHYFFRRSQVAESRQQVSEDVYRQLFESSLDAVLLTTPDGGIQAANPAAARIFQRSEAEICRVGRAGLLDESEARSAAALNERAGTGRFHGELTFRRGDGSLFPGEVSSSLFTTADGVGHAVITIHDVTERNQAADLLRQNERRLDYALRSAGLGAWNLDLNDRSAWRSDQHARIFGFKDASQPWGYQAFIAHVLPEDRPAAQAALEQGVNARQEMDFECRIRREDGALRWLWLRASPELDSDGRPLKMFGIVQDITDRKTAELRLLRLNRLYATLGQINQVMVGARDRDGLLEAICRAAVEPGQYLMAWVGLIDETSQAVTPAVFAGAEGGYLSEIQIVSRDEERGRGPTGTALREGRCVICQDTATDLRMAPWREATLARGFRSSASVPFRQGGRVIGNLTVYAGEPGAFDDDDLALLNEIGGDISHALDRLETERARRQADAAVREREAQLSAIVENAGPAIWSADAGGRLTMANTQFHQLLKLLAPDAHPKVGDAVPPPGTPEPIRSRFSGLYARALAGETATLTAALTDDSGQMRHYEGILSPIRRFDGAIEGTVGVITEVTARVQADVTLREREARLTAVVENAGPAIWSADANGRLTMTNSRFREFYALVGSGADLTLGGEVPPPTAREPMRSRIAAWYASAVAGETVSWANSFPDESGQPRYFEGTVSPIRRPDGGIEGAVGVINDVTARVQADAALREREARLSAIVENAGAIIWSLDSERRLTMANAAFYAEASALHPDHVIDLGEVMPPSYVPEPLRAQIEQNYARALSGERAQRLATLPGPLGNLTYNEYTYSPIRQSDGEVVGIVCFGWDITARRQAEEQIRLQAELLEWSHATIRDLDSRIVSWGRGMQQLYGYTPAEAVGRISHDLFQTRYPVSQADYESRLFQNGEWEGELEHSRRDGARLRVAGHHVLYRDHDGKPSAILEVNNDITALRQAEVDLRRRYTELAALYDTSHRLQRLLPLNELSVAVIGALETVLQYTFGAVLLLDETGQTLYPFVLSVQDDGPADEAFLRAGSLRLGAGITGWVAENGVALRVDDVRADPRYVALRPDIRSELCVPLRLQDKVIGVVNVESAQPGAYSADDQRLLETVAAQLAVAIQNSRLLEELRQNVARQAELSRRVSESYESASRAIGLELHDQIGQMLTALKLTLTMLPQLGPEPAARKLADSRDLVDELLGRVSRLSLQLRPPMLDDLGLLATLLWHVNRYHQQTGLEVDFRHSGLEGRRFNAQVETNAYRIVQEALTNVARYAGASRTDLRVTAGSDVLEIVLEDNGRGFDPQQALAGRRSTGLSGMRERAALLGGSFELTSQPGAGARVWVRLPLEEQAP